MGFKEFRKRFAEECKAHENSKFYTVSGLFCRLFGSEKYWSEYTEREASIVRYAKAWIPQLISRNELSAHDLPSYKIALENTNTSLKKRTDFIVTVTTGISVIGLTDLNSFFIPASGAPPKSFLAVIALVIALALVESIKVQRQVDFNEKLARVIGDCI